MKKNILYFLACIFVLQGCSDPAERAAEYLESGKAYYQQGNYAKAKVELKNALQINNRIADAYYHLALIDEQDQKWKGMFANLHQTILIKPDQYDARLKLAKLYFLSGEIEDAKSEMDIVLANVTDNPDVIALNGVILLKQGDEEAALAEAKKALAINPQHSEAINLQILVYKTRKDYKTTEKLINQAIKSNPDELSLRLLKLQLHIDNNNKLAIEQDYRGLIKDFPEEYEFSYELARYYISEQRDDEALALMQAVADQNTDLLAPKLILVNYLAQKDIQQAEATLQKLLAKSPDDVDLYFKLASLQIQQQKFEAAKKPLYWIVEHKGDEQEGLDAKAKLAMLALQEDDMNTVSALLAEVLAVDEMHYKASLLTARIDLMNGQDDEAITALRRIIRDYPQSDEAMVLLAQAYLKKGSPELAEENFRKALDLNPGNFSAVMPIVSRMVDSKELARAEEVLLKVLKIKPGNEDALQALAKVRLLGRDWQGAQEVVGEIASKPSGKGYSYYLGGKISQGQGLYIDAIEKYKLALVRDPDLSDALKSMVACYEALKQKDKMFVYLDEFMLKNPEVEYPILLKAQLYSLNKNWEQALIVLNQGIQKWPEAAQFYILMAEIYHEKNEPLKVILSYQKGLGNIPDSVPLNMMLAAVYEQENQHDKAVEVYETLIAIRPDMDIAVNNLVSILLDQYSGKENTEKALQLAQRFETSKQPYFLDTYGWALLQNGNTTEAVMVFKQVVSKAPEIAVFHYHLGVAYHKANNNALAIKSLEKALVVGAIQGGFAEKPQAETLLKKLKALPKEKEAV